MLYMVTFTINIPQMLAYIPYMDPMGNHMLSTWFFRIQIRAQRKSITSAGRASLGADRSDLNTSTNHGGCYSLYHGNNIGISH